jgi:hypothetical protein
MTDEPIVFKFDIGCSPIPKGSYEEFQSMFVRIEGVDSGAPGVTILRCFIDETDERLFYLANHEDMLAFAQECNQELTNVLNSLDLDAPEDQA